MAPLASRDRQVLALQTARRFISTTVVLGGSTGLWAYGSQAGARRRTGPAEPSSEKAAGAVASSTARHSPRLHELGGLAADARALGRSEQQDAGRRRWRCETGAGLPQWLPPVWPVWSSAHGRLSWHHWAGSPVGVPRGPCGSRRLRVLHDWRAPWRPRRGSDRGGSSPARWSPSRLRGPGAGGRATRHPATGVGMSARESARCRPAGQSAR